MPTRSTPASSFPPPKKRLHGWAVSECGERGENRNVTHEARDKFPKRVFPTWVPIGEKTQARSGACRLSECETPFIRAALARLSSRHKSPAAKATSSQLRMRREKKRSNRALAVEGVPSRRPGRLAFAHSATRHGSKLRNDQPRTETASLNVLRGTSGGALAVSHLTENRQVVSVPGGPYMERIGIRSSQHCFHPYSDDK